MISAVIPTYNSEEYVERTLNSVLAQTFRDFEIVVVDDGSADGTVQTVHSVLREAGWTDYRVLTTDHRGPGAARNEGVRAARHDWIAFLDSDDLWVPEKLDTVVTTMRAFPDVNWICHYERELLLDGTEREIGISLEEWDRSRLVLETYRRNMFTTSGVAVKRALLFEAGLFDETLPAGQDRDLWIRLSYIATPFWLRECLGHYINRAGNISSNLERRFQCSLRISKRYRKRLASHTRAPRLHVLAAIAGCRARAVRHYLLRGEMGPAARHAFGLASDLVELVLPLDPGQARSAIAPRT